MALEGANTSSFSASALRTTALRQGPSYVSPEAHRRQNCTVASRRVSVWAREGKTSGSPCAAISIATSDWL